MAKGERARRAPAFFERHMSFLSKAWRSFCKIAGRIFFTLSSGNLELTFIAAWRSLDEYTQSRLAASCSGTGAKACHAQ